MIQIDGSHGGGQLLRTALSLSAITKKPFHIINARSKRDEPGLKPQHLAVLNAMAKICEAEVKGNIPGSQEVEFVPHAIKGGKISINIGTAGSTTLIVQTLIPALLREQQKSDITITGGTDTKWCPMSLYVKYVYGDFLKRMGVHFSLDVQRFGFYPKGGGKVIVTIDPCKEIKEISFIERGKKQEITLCAYVSQDLKERKVAERLIESVKNNLDPKEKIATEKVYVDTMSTGCFLHGNITYNKYKIGDGILGEKEKTAEQIGKEMAQRIKDLMNTDGVDHFAADQLMIFMALKGQGTIKTTSVTDHIATNAAVIEKFLPVKFSIKGNVIECGPVV